MGFLRKFNFGLSNLVAIFALSRQFELCDRESKQRWFPTHNDDVETRIICILGFSLQFDDVEEDEEAHRT